MSGDLFTISEDARLEEAAFQLNADMVSGAPVYDGDGKIVGIITKTDIVNVERDHKALGMERVKDWMHRGVRTILPDASAREAVELMSEHNLHRLLVASTEGEPVGIVTSMDVVHAVAKGASFAT